MTPAEKIEQYFRGATGTSPDIGAEIETSFVDEAGQPVSLATSQTIFTTLVAQGWQVHTIKVNKTGVRYISAIISSGGDRFCYELGRQNFELATVATRSENLLTHTKRCLNELYRAAKECGARPVFRPQLVTDEDTLAVLEKRDEIWAALDGRAALRSLGLISSVQFTIPVTVDTAIPVLNRLADRINDFLADYPQEMVWRRYIAESEAGYLTDRYGGPLQFESLTDYCEQLAKHDVVVGSRLVTIGQVNRLDVDLFLRSIWWYFRLRRHGDQLCVEIRPLPRRGDDQLEAQLVQVIDSAYAS